MAFKSILLRLAEAFSEGGQIGTVVLNISKIKFFSGYSTIHRFLFPFDAIGIVGIFNIVGGTKGKF